MKWYDPYGRLLIVIAIIAAAVMFAGCVEDETQKETQIKIVDVDVTAAGLSQLKVDMTIKNVGDTTAKNVIASAVTVSDEYRDDVLNSSSLLRMYTENEGGLCLDREYLGDIEPDQYAKASLIINTGDLSEGCTTIKAATADNAEAVYY